MADQKISALSDGGALAAADLLVIARSGANFRVVPPSLDQLAAIHAAAGNVDLNNHKITGLATPTLSADAATKAYVDGLLGGGGGSETLADVLNLGADAGGIPINNLGQPTDEADAATKEYVDVLDFNIQSATSYTLALTDMGLVVSCVAALATTITVPTNATVAFPVGTQILLRQFGGTVTVAGATGVTVESRGGLTSLAGPFAWATLVKVSTNTWDLFGDLA